MVAISLYRGNLHKVPDVPRRWLMPKHTISIKNFKSLLRKREKALSLLLPPPSNPNPNFTPEEENHEFVDDNGCSKQNNDNLQITVYQPPQLPPIDDPVKEIVNKEIEIEKVKEGDGKDQSRSDGVEEKRKGIGDCGVPESAEMTQKEDEVTAIEIKSRELQKSENEKKKIDVEEKLKDLNERKHKLVQMLKQILNAEEEIKRRGNIVISAPSASQQVDAATNVLNKIGAEAAANCLADLKGESEDDNNNNSNTNAPQSNQQQTLLNSPTIPSRPPSSPLQKLSHASALPLTPATDPSPTSRPCQTTTTTTTTTTTSSAGIAPPTGNPPLGNSTPILSTMSATHCTTSSPSPVASGGTSVFRDPRITSPSWS